MKLTACKSCVPVWFAVLILETVFSWSTHLVVFQTFPPATKKAILCQFILTVPTPINTIFVHTLLCPTNTHKVVVDWTNTFYVPCARLTACFWVFVFAGKNPDVTKSLPSLPIRVQSTFKGLHRGGVCVTGRPHPFLAKRSVGGSHDGPCDVRSLNIVAEMKRGV